MINRGIATFTLDYGKCPPWLFNNSEMNHVFKKNISLSGINAGSINLSHSSNSAVTGTKAAGAVYNGILNSVSANRRGSK